MAVEVFLVAAAFVAVGFFSADLAGAAPFLASLTGPEGPFGRSKSPFFSPFFKAAEMCWESIVSSCIETLRENERSLTLSKEASVVEPRLLFALTYLKMRSVNVERRVVHCHTIHTS